MKKILSEFTLWLGMLFCSIVVGATIYQMIVIVPEYYRDIPHGMIEFARGHFLPKAFWTSPIMPLGCLAMIGALIFNWNNSRRKWLLLSVVLIGLAEIVTILFIFPQMKIMGLLDGNPSTDLDLLTQSIRQWVLSDHLRFWLLLMPAYFIYLKALTIKNDSDLSSEKK